MVVHHLGVIFLAHNSLQFLMKSVIENEISGVISGTSFYPPFSLLFVDLLRSFRSNECFLPFLSPSFVNSPLVAYDYLHNSISKYLFVWYCKNYVAPWLAQHWVRHDLLII